MRWQVPETLDQIGHNQIRHKSNVETICASLQFLLDVVLLLFVEIRYTPITTACSAPGRSCKATSRVSAGAKSFSTPVKSESGAGAPEPPI